MGGTRPLIIIGSEALNWLTPIENKILSAQSRVAGAKNSKELTLKSNQGLLFLNLKNGQARQLTNKNSVKKAAFA